MNSLLVSTPFPHIPFYEIQELDALRSIAASKMMKILDFTRKYLKVLTVAASPISNQFKDALESTITLFSLVHKY
jgi:hypothetical protein